MNTTHKPEPNAPHVYDVELTDTFGGEANYCWVVRETLVFAEPYTEMQLRRAAKRAVRLTGIKREVSDYGDTVEFRPRGLLQVAFVTFRY